MRRAYLWFGAGLLLAAALPAVAQFYQWPTSLNGVPGPVSITGSGTAGTITTTGSPGFVATPQGANATWFQAGGVTHGFLAGVIAGSDLLYLGPNAAAPVTTNFVLNADTNNTVLNAPTTLIMRVNNVAVQTCTSSTCSIASGIVQQYAGSCDSTGAPGNATCNQAAGRAAIASTAATVTITDSVVTATSNIQAVLQFTDATCTSIKSVVPGAGAFVINTNAACAANSNVAWVVVSK